MHNPIIRAILTKVAEMLPNYALQTALSKTSGVETIHLSCNERKAFEIRGLCTLTINSN